MADRLGSAVVLALVMVPLVVPPWWCVWRIVKGGW